MSPSTLICRLAVIGIVAAGLALPHTAMAQDPDRPTTRPGGGQGDRPPGRGAGQNPLQVEALLGGIEEAAASVGLTEDQKARVEELLARARQDLHELLPRLQDMPPETRRQELQAVVAGLIEEVNGSLTAEQKPTFREAIERFRDQGRGQAAPTTRPGPGGPPPDGGPRQQLQMIMAVLGEMELSQEQNARLDEVLTRVREGAQQLQQVEDPRQRASEMNRLMRALRESMVQILTPEQQQEFQRRMAEQHPVLTQMLPALRQIGLNEDQQGQVASAVTELRQGLREAAQMEANRARNIQIDRLVQGFRERLAQILTPEQRQELERLMGPPQNRPPQDRPPQQGDRGQQDGAMMTDGMQAMGGASDARRDRPPTSADRTESAFLDRLNEPQGMEVGTTLPESVNVVTLAGKQRPLKSFVPGMQSLIVLMGSASSPTFRDRLSDLEWLRHETLRDAEILIIYTREQHAAGEWTVARNEAEGIEIPQHADLDARIAAARELRENADLKVEIVVDAMDDKALEALVGRAPHCAALVFAPGGKLVGKQQWLDPSGIPALVAEARQRE